MRLERVRFGMACCPSRSISRPLFRAPSRRLSLLTRKPESALKYANECGTGTSNVALHPHTRPHKYSGTLGNMHFGHVYNVS